MNELPLTDFQSAIAALHGGAATLLSRTVVEERFQGAPVWNGEVLVFKLEGHPKSRRCFAWSVDGKITAVLQDGPIHTAADAVRAAIAADHRK